jgi:hypothetical protein
LADWYAHHVPNFLSPLCKTFVGLKHSTTAQGFFVVRLIDRLKLLLENLPNFLAEFGSSPVAQTAAFSISAASKQLLSTTVTFFLNIPYERYCLLERKRNGHDTISWLHVSSLVHNSVTMRPIHEILTVQRTHFMKF